MSESKGLEPSTQSIIPTAMDAAIDEKDAWKKLTQLTNDIKEAALINAVQTKTREIDQYTSSAKKWSATWSLLTIGSLFLLGVELELIKLFTPLSVLLAPVSFLTIASLIAITVAALMITVSLLFLGKNLLQLYQTNKIKNDPRFYASCKTQASVLVQKEIDLAKNPEIDLCKTQFQAISPKEAKIIREASEKHIDTFQLQALREKRETDKDLKTRDGAFTRNSYFLANPYIPNKEENKKEGRFFQEWSYAEKFFDKFPGAIKLSRKDMERAFKKMGQDAPLFRSSFIKMGRNIYRIEEKSETNQPLKAGSFATIKSCYTRDEDRRGKTKSKYVIGISDTDRLEALGDTEMERALLERLGMTPETAVIGSNDLRPGNNIFQRDPEAASKLAELYTLREHINKRDPEALKMRDRMIIEHSEKETLRAHSTYTGLLKKDFYVTSRESHTEKEPSKPGESQRRKVKQYRLMKRVPGESLDKLVIPTDSEDLKKFKCEQSDFSKSFLNNLTPDKFLWIALETTRKLQEDFHDQNLIHGDLSLGNVMVDVGADGTPKNVEFIDFDTVRRLNEEGVATVKGDPSYSKETEVKNLGYLLQSYQKGAARGLALPPEFNTLLSEMTQKNKLRRPDISQVIGRLEAMHKQAQQTPTTQLVAVTEQKQQPTSAPSSRQVVVSR